jgi:hypothetical protein
MALHDPVSVPIHRPEMPDRRSEEGRCREYGGRCARQPLRHLPEPQSAPDDHHHVRLLPEARDDAVVNEV